MSVTRDFRRRAVSAARVSYVEKRTSGEKAPAGKLAADEDPP